MGSCTFDLFRFSPQRSQSTQRFLGALCDLCGEGKDVRDEIELSPVFIAASVAEVTFVEELLAAEAIEYEVRPEAFLRATFGGVCLQGLVFEVPAGQAEYCRRLFRDRGLERGVIEPPEDQP